VTLIHGCRARAVAIFALLLWGLLLVPGPLCSLEADNPTTGSMGDEPITPIPEPRPVDAAKAALGERLFKDTRLSRDNTLSCQSCHDLGSNGASRRSNDTGIDGSSLPFNTLTVFNAALSFRLNWEGTFRSLEEQAAASIDSPQLMGSNVADVAKKLDADPAMRQYFTAAYGRGPDAANIPDAIANFERTLTTPGSRFDRWLAGDVAALSATELSGYRLFKSLGCVSCHQGVNIGGNLYQRQGVFHPLAPKPEVLRVPSLRNVADTPPYFHDGSARTLEEAVRRMSFAQLNSKLVGEQIEQIVAYLRTLSGTYRGTSDEVSR
jgi:cytochrome c peroxidase